MFDDLAGRWFLVTGAAGHIGRNLVANLMDADACVIGVDLSDPPPSYFASTSRSTEKLHYLQGDLADNDFLFSIRAKVESITPKIFGIVNNAGFVGSNRFAGWTNRYSKESYFAWNAALELNLTVPYVLTEELAPLMERGGSIVNVSSIYGSLAPKWALYEGTEMLNPAAYGVSKAGLIHLTKWHSSFYGEEFRVNSVSPGGVARGQDSGFVAKYIAMTHSKMMISEEDVVSAIRFLLSSASKSITGQNIIVDGGFSA
jgi:NAD(P)-dependent dehydrogenase (short-subunit alcohol dehydrogenase family)